MSRRFVTVSALVFLCSLICNISSNAQTAGSPELPRVFLSTSYPTVSGNTVNVDAGGNLQAALNNAQPGDTIVLQAGATYTGNFVLPAKSGTGWIIIRTSNIGGISAEGTRVAPVQSSAMPRILSPNPAPAFATAASAHHFRLVGLEIGVSNTVSINYGLVSLGDAAQTSSGSVPHDLVIDRCYIHGNSAGDLARGVGLNSASTAVIDSYISECHGVGFDTQAIAGWNGPGPFKIVNNYLEGAAENVMFGGADPKIVNLVPSDIEFRRNNCFKQLKWNIYDASYAGVHWTVKNIFELKNAQRVLVDGNVFENNWVDGQAGVAILFTPRNQENTAPWSVVQDVTFTNNVLRHTAAAVHILGTDNLHPSQPAKRIAMRNNLFFDVGGAQWGGSGRLFQIIDGPSDIQIDHTTSFQTYNIITADGAPSSGFVFTNNIALHNDYGVIGSGHGIGNDTINYYFPACFFTKNVLVGGPSSAYPAGDFFPSTVAAVGFVDVSSANYRLSLTSSYKNAGTDGKDLGADLDAIDSAYSGGGPPPPPPNQPPSVTISATTTTGVAPLAIGFVANASDSDGSIASYLWDFGDGQSSTLPSVSHTYQSGNFTVRVTVTDNLGANASATLNVAISSSSVPSPQEIVLYASDASVRNGNWSVVSDTTAAGGKCLRNADAGAAKITVATAAPTDFFELTFNATAGIPYRLWIRGRADVDSPYNDSVFVQFSGSVDSSGAAVFRISTTDATTVNLEDCLSCGLQGWGWQDNGWGAGVFGPLIYFSTTGQQTLRVQVREDGISIDQIVLSPILFLSTSPGVLKNDNTILPKTSSGVVPRVITITPNSGPTDGQAPIVITGSGFAAAATVSFGGVVAPAAQVTSDTSINTITPAHVEGNVDVRVTNPDSQSSALVNGYKYVSPAPTVRMITPNGGESLVVGSSYSITWSISGGGITQQEIQLSLDSGATWSSLFGGLPATATSVTWQVPKSPSRAARIKIRSSTIAGVVVEDTSDRDFSILNRSKR